MKVYFNSLGVITNVDTEGDSLRQGTVGVRLEAIFSGITNTNFVATYNFKRHDNTKVSNVSMDISSENTEKFESVFNDEWFFAKAGQTTITIFLRDANNNIVAQGQIQFNIEANDYDEDFDPQITVVQYNQLLALLAKKLQVNSKVRRVDALPLVGDSDTFYVVKDDESETLHHVYFYNTVTHEYVWVGSNEIDLGAYYTTEEGEEFESGINAEINSFKTGINERVTSVENELQSVAQGSPKGTFATVSALSSAYPSGTTGIFVVSADGHWYYWNGSAWTDGGQYLSGGTENFLSLENENPVQNKVIAGLLPKLLTYDLIVGRYGSSGYESTAYWRTCSNKFIINANKISVLRKALSENAPSGNFRVTFYDSTDTYISVINDTSNNWGVPLDVPSNAKFARLSFNFGNTTNAGNANLWKRYVAGLEQIVIDENFDVSSLLSIQTGITAKALFKKVNYDLVKGRYRGNNIETDIYWRTYTRRFTITSKVISFWHETSTPDIDETGYIVAFYGSDGNYISRVEKNNASDWGVAIPVPTDAVYCRFSFRHSSGSDYTEATEWTRYVIGAIEQQIADEVFSLSEQLPPTTSLVSKALFEKANWDLQRGRWTNGGSVTEANGYFYSTYDYLKITRKTISYFSETSDQSINETVQIFFYDEDFNYLSSIGYIKTINVLDVPAGAKYVRFNFRNVTTVYSPYGIDRYVIGVEPKKSVVEKYKEALDKSLTMGYKVDALGNIPYLNFLHISDTHGSINTLNAIKIFNEVLKGGYCSFMIHTGDICGAYPKDGTKEILLDNMADANGDIFLVAGNHDVGSTYTYVPYVYTDQEYHDNILSYMLNRTSVTNNPTGKNYYYKDFASNHVRLIVLYAYETDFELADENNLKYIRGAVSYSQAQIDWLITALSTVPSGYGVIISQHEPLNVRGTTDNPFNSLPTQGRRTGQGYVSSDMIPDIVQAFIDKTTINREYAQTGAIVTTLEAVGDFSSSNGEFICYLDGHLHADGVSFLADYPDQLELNVACDNFHYLHGNDSKNIQGTLLQDVINCVSVDMNKGNIHILRIGNNFSSQAIRRDFTTIKFRRS